MKQNYRFDYCCVSPTSEQLEELDFIVDNMVEISVKTFLKYVPLDEINSSLLFNIRYEKKQILKDWGIRFFKIKRKNVKAYVMQQSAIEYVFKP